jgi:O-antigen/teichoic acid export membrane protein
VPAPSVVRMSLWAVSAQLSITLLSAVTSIIQNRTLGPEGRGDVALVQLWPVLLSGIAGAGWASALGGCISRSLPNARAYVSAAQLSGLAISVLAFIAGWWAIPWLMSDAPGLWELGRWFLLIIPLNFWGQSAVAGLEAMQRYDMSSRVRVGNLIAQLGFLVPLALLQVLTPETYCAAVTITAGVAAAYSFWLFAKVSSGSWRPQWGPLPAFVMRAAPLSWAQVFQLRIDQFAIALLVPLNPTAFGAYIVGTTLANMIAPIAHGLGLVLLPESARRAEADAVRLFARMGRFFVLGAVLLALPASLAAPWLLTLFYGSEFASAAYALRIGLMTAVLAGLFTMGLSTMQGAGRPGTAALIGIVGCAASVGGSIVLLPLLGYLGAALGQALGMLVGLCVMGVAYRREGLTAFSFMPRGADVRSLWISVTPLLRSRPVAAIPPCETSAAVGISAAPSGERFLASR